MKLHTQPQPAPRQRVNGAECIKEKGNAERPARPGARRPCRQLVSYIVCEWVPPALGAGNAVGSFGRLIMKTRLFISLVGVALCLTWTAQAEKHADSKDGHIIVSPDKLVWKANPSLPPGAQAAVLSG